MNRVLRLATVLGILLIAGCSSFGDLFPDEPKPKLAGDRISVLNLEHQLEPDSGLANLEIKLPRPMVNRDWPEAGGDPAHQMQHLALADDVQELWKAGIGVGDSSQG